MPYQLNPHMPEEGIPMERYYTAKFGEQGAAMARDMNGSRCGKMGRAVGLDFSGAKMVINTMRSHLLMEWAADQSLEKQHSLAEVLFKYHFADGRNANDVDTLVLAAEEAGLDGKKAREGLEDRDIRSKVDTMLMAARTVRGITGVPHFEITGPNGSSFQMSGAQPPDNFVQVFERLLSK
ncbi:uncharacterized protein LOC134189285 [Corticium candelabrum]|uniref:uncharacterized protein LOC134189285 n=1 Tax=Corticium candelabrum TaxID=121492 RepID=UPI002E26B65C|nr:uncharacterized protein LOC134189285 [Corticium candelabrum]